MHLTSKCRINSSLMMLLLLTSSIGAQIGNAATFEKLKTAPVFGTGMVLQCGEPIRIWGTSAVGDKISVTLGAQNRGVTTSTDGNWSVVFPPKKASFEPLALTVNEIQFDDILIGEVWICAGQSNMQFSLKQCDSGNEMLRRADNPNCSGAIPLISLRPNGSKVIQNLPQPPPQSDGFLQSNCKRNLTCLSA
jgi:hypothetical protein